MALGHKKEGISSSQGWADFWQDSYHGSSNGLRDMWLPNTTLHLMIWPWEHGQTGLDTVTKHKVETARRLVELTIVGGMLKSWKHESGTECCKDGRKEWPWGQVERGDRHSHTVVPFPLVKFPLSIQNPCSQEGWHYWLPACREAFETQRFFSSHRSSLSIWN